MEQGFFEAYWKFEVKLNQVKKSKHASRVSSGKTKSKNSQEIQQISIIFFNLMHAFKKRNFQDDEHKFHTKLSSEYLTRKWNPNGRNTIYIP